MLPVNSKQGFLRVAADPANVRRKPAALGVAFFKLLFRFLLGLAFPKTLGVYAFPSDYIRVTAAYIQVPV
jgi:hypothetical protein